MRIFLSILLVLSFIQADDVLPLHLLPCKHTKNASGGHQHGGHRKADMFDLIGYKESLKRVDFTYITSTLEERKDILLTQEMIIPPKSGFDNYHVMVANTSQDNKHYTAVYYKYKHGKPSRTSPKKLTSKQKGTLEIVPNPLPREHDRYYGSKSYTFLLKFNGKVLANHQVKLNTENKTLLNYTTDEGGKFEITLPNDFQDVIVSKRANIKPHFILSAQIKEGEQEYFTTFANPYNVNPHDYWSSTPQALICVVLGVFIGLYILWRRKNG